MNKLIALVVGLLGSADAYGGGLSFARPQRAHAVRRLTALPALHGASFSGGRGDGVDKTLVESAGGYSSGFYQGPPKVSAVASAAATQVVAAPAAATPAASAASVTSVPSKPAVAGGAAAKSAGGGGDKRGLSPFLQKLLEKKQKAAARASQAARPSPVVAAPVAAAPGVITKLTGRESFAKMLESNAAKIVVVKFYSEYCQACKTMSPKFIQAAQTTVAQQETGVNAKTGEATTSALEFVFCEIDFVANRELCRSLGMSSTKLPRVHFYHGSHGRIEDMLCGSRRGVRILKQQLSAYASEGIGAFTGQPTPVFVDDAATDISMASTWTQSAGGISSGFYAGPPSTARPV